MKSHHSIIFSSLLFALLTFTSYAIALDDCSFLVFNNDLRYDVCDFNDRKLPFEISYDNRPTEYYNISMGLTKASVPTCKDATKTTFATIKDLLKEDTCSTLASVGPDVTMIDAKDENSGLIFTFPKDTSAEAFGKSLIVSVKCDLTAPTGSGTKFTVQDITDEAINIIGSSSSACPTSHLSKFIAFLHNYKNIFFVLFLVIGLVICFFGYQLFNFAVFTLATIAGTSFTGILVFFFTDYSTKSFTLWLLFAVCLVIGILLGVLALKLEPLGFLILGIVLGVVAGSFLYNAAIAPFFKGSPVVLYLTEILSGLIGALLAYKLWKDVIMVGTAYIGSYMVCKSLAAFIGGFPTEDSIADGISNWTPETYIYLALIVILTFFGGITQYRRQKAEELVNEESNRYARVVNGPDTSDI